MSSPEEIEIDSFLDGIPQPQTYAQLQAEIRAEQAGKSREEIARDLTASSEAIFDPETAIPPVHHWIDRGEIMSCEGADHPNHRHFKAARK